MKLIYVDDSTFDQMAFKRLLRNFPEIDYEVYASFKELAGAGVTSSESILIRDCYLGDSSSFDFKGLIYFVSGGKPGEQLKKELDINEDNFFQKPLTKAHINNILNQPEVQSGIDEIDFEYIKDLSDGDEEFEREMKQIYIDEVPDQISAALNFFTQKEYKKFSETIHAIRTKLRTFGLEQLDELANYLENEARTLDSNPNHDFKSKVDEFKKRLDVSVSKMEQAI